MLPRAVLARPHSAPHTHTVDTQTSNRVSLSAPVTCVAQLLLSCCSAAAQLLLSCCSAGAQLLLSCCSAVAQLLLSCVLWSKTHARPCLRSSPVFVTWQEYCHRLFIYIIFQAPASRECLWQRWCQCVVCLLSVCKCRRV